MIKINPEYALPQEKNIKPSETNNNESNVSVFGDKNGNGIIDKEDFSDELAEKLENNHLLNLFDGVKWTDNLKKIFTSIISGGTPKGEILTEQYLDRNVLYDSKTNTLKIATKTGNMYHLYQECKYDNIGQNIEQKYFERNAKYIKDGKEHNLSTQNTDIYIRSQGFENENLKKEDVINVKTIVENNKEFFFKTESNKYDEKGNKTETIKNLPEFYSKSRRVQIIKNNETIIIKYDRDNNIVSKTKLLKEILKHNEDGTTHKEHIDEIYDPNNNLLYRTTKIEDTLEETSRIDSTGKVIENAVIKKVATREYANGNVYSETSDESNIKAELKDKNGNMLEKYTLRYNPNLNCFEKVFDDGSRKKADFEPLTN